MGTAHSISFRHCMQLLMTLLVIAMPASALAQGPAPRTCIDSAFKAPPGQASLSFEELRAICDPQNEPQLLDAISVCKNAALSFPKDRAVVCAGQPEVRIRYGRESDAVARAYHAAGKPLENVLERYKPRKPEHGEAQAEGAGAGPATVIAQGIGDFLIKRAEQEVSAYATVEVFLRLCKKYKPWFPRTCTLLASATDGTEPVGLGALRGVVVRDIENLPAVAIERIGSLSPNQQTWVCVLDIHYALLKGIRATGQVDTLFRPTFELGQYRTTPKGSSCDTKWAALEKLARNVNASMTHWRALTQSLEQVRAGRNVDVASVQAMRSAFSHLSSLIPQTEETTEIFGEVKAIVEAAALRDWVEVVTAAATAKTLSAILLCTRELPEKKKTLENEPTPCKADLKLGATLTLVADIATADSSEGVTQAIERFAAPVGTWRRKYERRSLMLTGLVGLKAAYERVEGAYEDSWTLAPALSVGIDLNVLYTKDVRFGVYAQFLDIGNVANVRLEEEGDALTSVEIAPEIEVVQLFAPGAYLLLAPWKAPFVLALGGNWAPRLRTANDGAVLSAWHLGAMLAVDVSILELGAL